jgi:monoterpene epsilon-lactone hydrolase
MRVPAAVLRTMLATTVRPLLGPQVPVSVQRKAMDAFSKGTPLPRDVTVTEVRLAGRPARSYTPAGQARGSVLWLHGGAFITGSFATHGAFAAHLAKASGAVVHLLDYRLAPEHPHPAAVDDAVAALSLVPTGPVVLGGDSAGGCLALLAAERSPVDLAGLALISPVVDLTGRTAQAWTGRDILVRNDWLRQGVAAMFGDQVPEVLGSSLLPTVVHVSGRERLRAEGEELARSIGAELFVVPGMWHDVHLQAGLVRQADEAVARLGGSIRAFLSAAPR